MYNEEWERMRYKHELLFCLPIGRSAQNQGWTMTVAPLNSHLKHTTHALYTFLVITLQPWNKFGGWNLENFLLVTSFFLLYESPETSTTGSRQSQSSWISIAQINIAIVREHPWTRKPGTKEQLNNYKCFFNGTTSVLLGRVTQHIPKRLIPLLILCENKIMSNTWISCTATMAYILQGSTILTSRQLASQMSLGYEVPILMNTLKLYDMICTSNPKIWSTHQTVLTVFAVVHSAFKEFLTLVLAIPVSGVAWCDGCSVFASAACIIAACFAADILPAAWTTDSMVLACNAGTCCFKSGTPEYLSNTWAFEDQPAGEASDG